MAYADSALVDGRPNGISGEDLPRKPITVGLDINGNTNEPVVVNKPNRHRVMAAVNAMVQKWFEDGHKAAAKMSYRNAFVYDSRQIEAKLGIKRADKLFGVDFKAYSEGKQKEMLICFNQIYYTARVEPLTASSLFKDEVPPEDLMENYSGETRQYQRKDRFCECIRNKASEVLQPAGVDEQGGRERECRRDRSVP